MTWTPAWWRAIGGKWCVSVWSGLVGVAFVVPSALWTVVYSPLSLTEVAVAEVSATAISVFFLWWSHAWWLSPSRAGRPHRSALAIGTFAGIGLIRLVVLFGVREGLGIDQPWSPIQSLVTGGVYSIVMLSLVAVVVDSVRSHAATMEDLGQARESLEQAARVEQQDVESLQREYAEGMLNEVRSALESLRSVDSGQQVAQEIQDVSNRIVREGSHSLREGAVIDQAVAAPRRRVGLREVLAGVQPAAPIVGPIAFEVLVFTAIVRDLGTQLALINALVGTSVLIIGSLLLCQIANRRWPQRGRLPLLFVAYALIGVAATSAVQGAWLWFGESRSPWVGVVSVALFMTMASVVPSMRRAQSEAEGQLALSVADLAAELSRVKSLADEQRRHLSHLMHGGVQGEMTAAALEIKRAAEAGQSSDVIRSRADGLIALLEEQQRSLDRVVDTESLDDVLTTWSLALDIDIRVEGEARNLMACDPTLTQSVVDVVSEGLTNAVRHATTKSVEIVVNAPDRGSLHVAISHPGVLVQGPSGQGSALLDEVCDEWQRSAEGDRVTLTCRIRSSATTSV